MTNALPLMERIREGDRVTIREHGRDVAGKATMHGGRWYIEQGHPLRSWHVTTQNLRGCTRKGKPIFQVLEKEAANGTA